MFASRSLLVVFANGLETQLNQSGHTPEFPIPFVDWRARRRERANDEERAHERARSSLARATTPPRPIDDT